MNGITLSAYAKINLTLGITGVREDGYHTLSSIMQRVSLADTVTVERIPHGIHITCSRDDVPTDERCLCHKAARRYLEAAGLKGGVRIHLELVTPGEAGLGGGSADAAAVLRAMAALYPSEADLFAIAATLGADVPFALLGGTALCEGIGEEMTPLALPKNRPFAVIAKGKEGLSTPRIYALYDTLAPLPRKAAKDAARALQEGDWESFFGAMQNDLELPAMTLCPEIALLKEALLSAGADAAMMTGSGSAVFGLFFQEETARRAAEQLKAAGYFSSFCTLL